ncbi:energy transducer TonB [Acidiferrobacter sp.]|uniref:energy transducer TonB family protein n=1 Tax=Acidiferrobacter sp. TaxID=1872107 RepID=UPI00260A1ECF|nr:TonB family protein [Acidiferrobacter sp.]
MTQARLKPADRLGIAVFLTGLLELVLILGVRFDMPRGSHGHALDVTLVQAASRTKPRHARRLAQVNVDGGGGLHKKRAAHTPLVATAKDGGTPRPQIERRAHHAPLDRLRLLHTRRSPLRVTFAQPAWQLHAAIAEQLGIAQQLASEEARLKAEIHRDWRAARAAGRGRSGVSAREFAYASYIIRWVRHMERFGSRQYRRMFAGQDLSGSLVLEVSILRNGSLKDVKILRPSPYAALNRAAIIMVRRAAPFAPLPAVRGPGRQVLPIIETWRFEGGHMTDVIPSTNATP